MPEANNAILFTFGIIFIATGLISPLIATEFGQSATSYSSQGMEDIGNEDVTSTNAITVLSAVFFWIFGAPIWLNILYTMMRIIFWIIVYDKIRGI